MDEDALGQKDHQKGKDPLRHLFREEHTGKPPGTECGAHAEDYIYHPSGNQEHIKTVGEDTQDSQKVALNDIGKHGLEGVGTAITRYQYRRIISPREAGMVTDVLYHPKTVDLVRALTKGLYKGKDCHT